MAAPILWAPGILGVLSVGESPHAHKIPPFRGGGGFWAFLEGGGGSANSIFMGVGIFPIHRISVGTGRFQGPPKIRNVHSPPPLKFSEIDPPPPHPGLHYERFRIYRERSLSPIDYQILPIEFGTFFQIRVRSPETI